MINKQAHPPRAPHHIRRRHGPIPPIGGHRLYDLVLCVGGQVQELTLLEMHKGSAEAREEQGGARGGDGDVVGVGVVGAREGVSVWGVGGGEAGKDNVRDGKGKGEGGGKITGD